MNLNHSNHLGLNHLQVQDEDDSEVPVPVNRSH